MLSRHPCLLALASDLVAHAAAPWRRLAVRACARRSGEMAVRERHGSIPAQRTPLATRCNPQLPPPFWIKFFPQPMGFKCGYSTPLAGSIRAGFVTGGQFFSPANPAVSQSTPRPFGKAFPGDLTRVRRRTPANVRFEPATFIKPCYFFCASAFLGVSLLWPVSGPSFPELGCFFWPHVLPYPMQNTPPLPFPAKSPLGIAKKRASRRADNFLPFVSSPDIRTASKKTARPCGINCSATSNLCTRRWRGWVVVIHWPALAQNRLFRQFAFEDQHAAVTVSHHGAAVRESFPPWLRVGLVVLLRVTAHCSFIHPRASGHSAQARSCHRQKKRQPPR